MNFRTILTKAGQFIQTPQGRTILISSLLIPGIAFVTLSSFVNNDTVESTELPALASIVSGTTALSAEDQYFEIDRTTTEAIPYTTSYIDDPYMEKDATSIVTEGIYGQKAVTTHIVYKNGELISEEIISETVLSEPVNATVKRGTGEGGYITLEDGTVLRYSRRVRLEATAYNKENTSNITAIGTEPKRGTVAIDRRVISLGTKVYVTSISGKWVYGEGICEDTGVIGERIDLYMDSLAECYEFGRRDVYVYILD